MRKIFLILAAAVFAVPLFGQGIVFEELSFDQALTKAREENKLVFVDCYTEWCGPCKMLARDIFPQPEVGDFFNARFVNLQIDMEKGEGVELAKRFAITAYPTMLMIDPEGNVRHKVVGYVEAATLIEHGGWALDGEKSLAALAKAYDEGDRDPDRVLAYVVALLAGSEEEKATEIADEFFASLTDEQRADPALWPIYSNRSVAKWGSPWFGFLSANTSVFDGTMGREQVDAAIREATTDMFTDAIFYPREGVSLQAMPQLAEQIRAIDFDSRELVAAEAEFTVALTSQDVARTVELYERYGNRFSGKGIMVFLPIMVQNGQSDPENFPATKALIDMLREKAAAQEAAE